MFLNPQVTQSRTNEIKVWSWVRVGSEAWLLKNKYIKHHGNCLPLVYLALYSLPLKIFITIFKNLEGIFYAVSVSQKAEPCPECTHLLINYLYFCFILFVYNSWILHICILASAYGSSLSQRVGLSMICLMLSSATDSTAVSAPGQEQLGKQMLYVSNLAAKNWHCQIFKKRTILFSTDILGNHLALLIISTWALLVRLKVSISSTFMFSCPVFSYFTLRNNWIINLVINFKMLINQ